MILSLKTSWFQPISVRHCATQVMGMCPWRELTNSDPLARGWHEGHEAPSDVCCCPRKHQLQMHHVAPFILVSLGINQLTYLADPLLDFHFWVNSSTKPYRLQSNTEARLIHFNASELHCPSRAILVIPALWFEMSQLGSKMTARHLGHLTLLAVSLSASAYPLVPPEISEQCLCAEEEGAGWSSEENRCLSSSVTSCLECPTRQSCAQIVDLAGVEKTRWSTMNLRNTKYKYREQVNTNYPANKIGWLTEFLSHLTKSDSGGFFKDQYRKIPKVLERARAVTSRLTL